MWAEIGRRPFVGLFGEVEEDHGQDGDLATWCLVVPDCLANDSLRFTIRVPIGRVSLHLALVRKWFMAVRVWKLTVLMPRSYATFKRGKD